MTDHQPEQPTPLHAFLSDAADPAARNGSEDSEQLVPTGQPAGPAGLERPGRP
ncbi:hypothetical protein [Kitasatospora sp. NPDC088351]|uniref:hypothetical protein n=1 Tax=unclassified Kitasatospora TaxID=2633591 RepID=UPI0034213CA6